MSRTHFVLWRRGLFVKSHGCMIEKSCYGSINGVCFAKSGLKVAYFCWRKLAVKLELCTSALVAKVRAEQLPVYPAGASVGTDVRWWGCVIGICVARRGGNTQHSFPLSSLHTCSHSHTHTYRHPLQLVIAFSANCPLEYTFYCGRLLHRLKVNMCLQEHWASCSLGYTDMPESLVKWGEVNRLNIQPTASSAEGPIAMVIVVLHNSCCSFHIMHRFYFTWIINITFLTFSAAVCFLCFLLYLSHP